MRLDVCVPANNEAPIIAATIQALKEAFADLPNVDARIIVADNLSTDGTGDVVRNLNFPDVVVLEVPEKGKGAAVTAAARISEADLFGFIDADLSAHPGHFKDLLRALEGKADIAIGSRLHPEAIIERSAVRTASSRAFNLLRRAIVGIPIRDSQCGIKVTGKEGLTHLQACTETGWFFEVEWLRRAELGGLRIEEVPIVWQEFHFAERKSKLRVLEDGIAAIAAFLRIKRRVG